MRTTDQGRQQLLKLRADAKLNKLTFEGPEVLDRSTSTVVATLAIGNRKRADAAAKFFARAGTMVPNLIKDLDEAIGLIGQARALVAAANAPGGDGSGLIAKLDALLVEEEPEAAQAAA